MAWNNNKKLEKQDLIDAGLDPDKLKEFQEKGVTKENLDALKSELTTTITDQIKAGFTELETKLRPNSGGDNKGGENKGGENNEEVPEFDQFTTDPVGFVNKKVGTLGAQAAIELKGISRNAAYRELSKSLVGFSNATLKAEIDAEWAKYTPEVLARNSGDPEKLLTQIHDMIIGKHHNDIIQDRDKKDGKFNLVHSGGGGGTGAVNTNTTTNDGKRQLTNEEKAVAKKYGMSEDEWLQAEKDNEVEEAARHKVSA